MKVTCTEAQENRSWCMLPFELQYALLKHVANCPVCEEVIAKRMVQNNTPDFVKDYWNRSLEEMRKKAV